MESETEFIIRSRYNHKTKYIFLHELNLDRYLASCKYNLSDERLVVCLSTTIEYEFQVVIRSIFVRKGFSLNCRTTQVPAFQKPNLSMWFASINTQEVSSST